MNIIDPAKLNTYLETLYVNALNGECMQSSFIPELIKNSCDKNFDKRKKITKKIATQVMKQLADFNLFSNLSKNAQTILFVIYSSTDCSYLSNSDQSAAYCALNYLPLDQILNSIDDNQVNCFLDLICNEQIDLYSSAVSAITFKSDKLINKIFSKNSKHTDAISMFSSYTVNENIEFVYKLILKYPNYAKHFVEIIKDYEYDEDFSFISPIDKIPSSQIAIDLTSKVINTLSNNEKLLQIILIKTIDNICFNNYESNLPFDEVFKNIITNSNSIDNINQLFNKPNYINLLQKFFDNAIESYYNNDEQDAYPKLASTVELILGANPSMQNRRFLLNWASNFDDDDISVDCYVPIAEYALRDINPYELLSVNPIKKNCKNLAENKIKNYNPNVKNLVKSKIESFELERTLTDKSTDLEKFAPSPSTNLLKEFSILSYRLGIDPNEKIKDLINDLKILESNYQKQNQQSTKNRNPKPTNKKNKNNSI